MTQMKMEMTNEQMTFRNCALEEAAKIAEAWPEFHSQCAAAEGPLDPDEVSAIFATSHVIARKIRELKS